MGHREYNSNGTLNAYVIAPIEIVVGDRFGYKVIAVIDNKKYWSCFMGLTDWSDEDIQNHGDRVKPEIAKALFPSLAAMYEYYF